MAAAKAPAAMPVMALAPVSGVGSGATETTIGSGTSAVGAGVGACAAVTTGGKATGGGTLAGDGVTGTTGDGVTGTTGDGVTGTLTGTGT